jgi:hypothetical protein
MDATALDGDARVAAGHRGPSMRTERRRVAAIDSRLPRARFRDRPDQPELVPAPATVRSSV